MKKELLNNLFVVKTPTKIQMTLADPGLISMASK
jgi:hypothetical protein